MNKLTKLVTIIHNDSDSVIIKVKKNKRMELIKTAFFNGDEDMIRVTKTKESVGEHNTYTFFLTDGSHYSASDNTLVTDNFKKKMDIVYETIHDDFGIHLKGDKEGITNYIKTINDDKKKSHCFVASWYNGHDRICVHKDHIWFKYFKTIEDVENWISERYNIKTKNDTKSIHTNCNIRTFITE